MPKIKECTINSKRTVKVREQYLSFEVGFTADVQDMEDEKIDVYIASLYEEANSIIDAQAEEAVQSIVGVDK